MIHNETIRFLHSSSIGIQLGLPDEFCKNTGYFVDSDRSRLHS